MPEQYSIEEFAAKIRERRPDLADIPAMTLVGKTLAAAPELRQYLNTTDVGAASANQPWYKTMFNQDKQSPVDLAARTPGQVASDQAANVLKGVPQAVTGIPGAVAGAVNVIGKGLTGNASGAVGDVWNMVKSGATPLTVPLRQAAEMIKPGAVNAPTPDAPETAQAAQGAGAVLGAAGLGAAAKAAAPVVGNAFEAAKARFAPLVQSPGLDAATINKWMDVPAKEAMHGANPGQQLLNEKLLGATKEATKANVDAALTDSSQQLQKALNNASTASIDATDIVNKPLDAAKKAYGAPTEETFQRQLDAIRTKAMTDHPNLNNMTPAEAHQLKVELGDSIKWSGASYDTPINQAMIKIYRGLNDVIKTEAPGTAGIQSRWGNLYVASKNLAESIADDVVGKGTGPQAPTPPPSPAVTAAKAVAPYVKGAAGLGTAYGLYRRFIQP